MSVNAMLVAGALSSEQFDRLARECQNDLTRIPGVESSRQAPVHSPGHRGDAVTAASFALAFVTSGTVTALFTILKSYFDRGIEVSFDGNDSEGRPLKISMKGASLKQFETFLKNAGVLK